MPNPSEFKILRDEMDRLIAEVKKRDVHLKETFHIIDGLKIQNSELAQTGPEQGRKAAGIARGDLTYYRRALDKA